MSTPESTASAAEILEREIANTQRSPATTAAAILAAANGGVHVVAAVQLWMLFRLAGFSQYVPWAMLAAGAAFLALGSRIYGQRVRAVVACVVLAAIDGVAMVAWMVLCFASGFISLLTYLVALGSIATVVLSRRAYGPCVRTAQARQRAAAAGFDLDL